MLGLREKYQNYFRIGAAVNERTIRTHSGLLKKHFNSLTCENEMKYGSVCRAPGSYDFTAADKIYSFAKENGMVLHGHCFVWHNQTPDFIFENTTAEGLAETLREHMALIGNRYRDLVTAWDVVNEAIEDKTDLFYRDTKWYRMFGENYLDGIFLMAKELFPEKDLYYNDYNDSHPEKREKIYRLVKGMKERGVPIDGIGMQGHHNLYEPGIENMRRAIERYAELGVKLQITELDMSVFAFEDKTHLDAPTKDMMDRQAELYEKCFELYREYSSIIDTVTLWGVADDATWLDDFPEPRRKNWPLLFGIDHQPKEAYYRITNF